MLDQGDMRSPTSGTAVDDGLDTLLNIENVVGGQANDTITGAVAVNKRPGRL
jgi:hypothetical protein